MTFRGSLFGVLTVGMLALAGGCADTYKDERNALLKNNDDLTKQLDAQKAQNDAMQHDLEVARAAAATGGSGGSVRAPAGGTGDTGVFGTGSEGGVGISGAPKASKGTKVTASKGGEQVFELSADGIFDSGKSTLKPGAKKELDALVAKIKSEYATSHLTIEGHTDNIPFKKTSTMTNEKLGQNRAQAVVDYLVAHGVAKTHLTAVSKGDKEPKSPTNQAANRRVTVLVSK